MTTSTLFGKRNIHIRYVAGGYRCRPQAACPRCGEMPSAEVDQKPYTAILEYRPRMQRLWSYECDLDTSGATGM